jgi:hypothetical protein
MGTSHNRTVYAPGLRPSGVPLAAVVTRRLTPTAPTTPNFSSPGNLRFPLSGLQKRHIQPERYTTFFSPNLSSQAPSVAPEMNITY